MKKRQIRLLGDYCFLAKRSLLELYHIPREGRTMSQAAEQVKNANASRPELIIPIDVGDLQSLEAGIAKIKATAKRIVLEQVTEELGWEEPNSWDDQMDDVLLEAEKDAWEIVTGLTMDEIYANHEGESYRYIASQYIDFDLKAIPKTTIKL